MKTQRLIMTTICLLIFYVAAIAQDNPQNNFATSGGNNARTYVYPAPYIFGDGSRIAVKWKRDLDVAPYDTRRNAWLNFVFCNGGYMYFRGGYNAAQTQSGIIKVDPTDGSFVWASPLRDTVFTTATPIIGWDYNYASRCSDANPTVYALNRDGTVAWESLPLPRKVNLTMALYNGVLYGVTERDVAQGVSWAFAIDASNGFILHATPIAMNGDTPYGNTAFAPDVFGDRQHGLYWLHDSPVNPCIYGVKINTTTASLEWSYVPARAYPSNIVYNKEKNAVYALHWADYGSTVESFDPVTGALKWTARNIEMGGTFNGGFYMTHTLKANSSGFIFGGFSHDVWSISDPGDFGGSPLPIASIDWYRDGRPDVLGESQTMAVLIIDPNTDKQVYISGTSAAFDAGQGIDERRRLYALDATNGSLLWSWSNPDDVSPYNTGFNFRTLSVGPDGTLYYFDAEEGPHGTMYAIGIGTPPPQKPVITDVARTAILGITWQSQEGATYRVESSLGPYDPTYDESLMTWVNEVTGLPSSGISTSWTDTTSVAEKYYRVYTEVVGGDLKADDTVGQMTILIRTFRNMVSSMFEPYPDGGLGGGGVMGSASLNKIVGNQLTGHALNSFLSDNIEVWNNASSSYSRAWYKTGTTNSWLSMAGPFFGMDSDKGYWFNIIAGHPAKNVMFCGRVSKVSRSIPIAIGRNLVGSCFPLSCTLSRTALIASGFTGHGFNRFLSDNVEFWKNPGATYQRFWYKTGTTNAWQPWNVGEPLRDIVPGDSIWVNVLNTHLPFTWTYPVPPRP